MDKYDSLDSLTKGETNGRDIYISMAKEKIT